MKYKYAISAALLLVAFATSAQQRVRPPPASSITDGRVISNWVAPDLSGYATSASVSQIVASSARQLNFGATSGGTAAVHRFYFFCYAPGQPETYGPNGAPYCSDGGVVTYTGVEQNVFNNNPGGSN